MRLVLQRVRKSNVPSSPLFIMACAGIRIERQGRGPPDRSKSECTLLQAERHSLHASMNPMLSDEMYVHTQRQGPALGTLGRRARPKASRESWQQRTYSCTYIRYYIPYIVRGPVASFHYILRNMEEEEAHRSDATQDDHREKRKCDVVGHHGPGGPTRLRLDFSLSLRPEHWERHDARPWLHSRSARGSRASRDKKVQNLSVVTHRYSPSSVPRYMYILYIGTCMHVVGRWLAALPRRGVPDGDCESATLYARHHELSDMSGAAVMYKLLRNRPLQFWLAT